MLSIASAPRNAPLTFSLSLYRKSGKARRAVVSGNTWKLSPIILQLDDLGQICGFPVDQEIIRKEQKVEARAF
jgi:hypothetical protein